ncbi:50S ribosomal protein L13 [bacterium]|nr:50S ribosomal protein L13 [FCB group bacterium]MBL7190855.1 50S ribosomal protein L13 [bacterium]
MKTYYKNPSQVTGNWYVIDAKGAILGRLCTKIAHILRGKHRPEFTPFWDFGDHVIVLNADKIAITGKKAAQKVYFRHTGYPGGVKFTTLQKMLQTKPEEVIKHGVKGMLPKNRLGRKLFKKLKVYNSAEHPHAAQQPQPMNI